MNRVKFVELEEVYYRGNVPICHIISRDMWYQHYLLPVMWTLSTWLRWCLFLHCKVIIFPSVTRSSQMQREGNSGPPVKGAGRAIKDFIVIFITITVISNFWRDIFEAEQISCFSLKFHPLPLLFINGSCLQQLLLWCSHGDFLFSSFLWHLFIIIALKRIVAPSSSWIYFINLY